MYSASIPRLKLNLSLLFKSNSLKLLVISYCDIILLLCINIFQIYLFTDDYNKSINNFEGILYNLLTCFYI